MKISGAERRMKKIFEEYEKKGLRKSPFRYGKFDRKHNVIFSSE